MARGALRMFLNTLFFLSLVISKAITKEDIETENYKNVSSVNGVAMITRQDYSIIDGCDCGPHSSDCSFENGLLSCSCDNGYAQTNSTLKGKCEWCYCGPHGDKCEFMGNLKLCTCMNGMDYLTGECKPLCDCGGNGRCSLQNGAKVCDCDNGFQDNMGKCEECDCGDGRCEFVNGMKGCFCHNNLVEVRGKCQECDCGENSISCKIENSFRSKRCTCKEGYAVSKIYELLDESCKKCDCGSNGASCSISSSIMYDKHTCTCQYGDYLITEREGVKCKDCDCGPYSRSCRFSSVGGKRCECEEGYRAERETNYYGIGDDEYCNYIVEKGRGSGVSGWRIGTYILAVLLAVIIIGLLIAIVNKNMK